MIKVIIKDNTDLTKLDLALQHMGLKRQWSVSERKFVLMRFGNITEIS